MDYIIDMLLYYIILIHLDVLCIFLLVSCLRVARIVHFLSGDIEFSLYALCYLAFSYAVLVFNDTGHGNTVLIMLELCSVVYAFIEYPLVRALVGDKRIAWALVTLIYVLTSLAFNFIGFA